MLTHTRKTETWKVCCALCWPLAIVGLLGCGVADERTTSPQMQTAQQPSLLVDESPEGEDRQPARRSRMLQRMQQVERARTPERRERRSREALGDFDELVEKAARSTVAIGREDRRVGLATVVEVSNSLAYLVTKASLLEASKEDYYVEVRGRQYELRLVANAAASDLALLAMELGSKSSSGPLRACEWSDATLEPGRLLASPHAIGYRAQPRAMSAGVVSVAARRVLPRPGFLGVSPRDYPDGGALIATVEPGSAADRAGLQPRDVIVRVDDQSINRAMDLFLSLKGTAAGNEIEIKYLRDGDTKSISTKLGARGLSVDRLDRFQLMNQMGGALSEVRHGFASVLQHDMLIQPDECGGPVVDLTGDVVAINIARAGRTASYAIPSTYIRPIIERLIREDRRRDRAEDRRKRYADPAAAA